MKVEKIGKVSIGRSKAREGYEYPYLRLPAGKLNNWIGKKSMVFRLKAGDEEAILIADESFVQSLEGDVQKLHKNDNVVQIDNIEERLSRLENSIRELKELISANKKGNKAYFTEICRGGDSNPRPPDYESGAPTS